MAKTIISVGYLFPGNVAQTISLRSTQSILDADIVVFEPSLSAYRSDYNFSTGLDEQHQGRRQLSESESGKFLQELAHWRAELQAFLEAGRTLFVYLAAPEEVSVFTGEKIFSGTGKSRATTRMVTFNNSYDFLPVNLGKLIPKGGQEIKVARDLGALVEYWRAFASSTVYEAYLDVVPKHPLLATKIGNRPIAGILSIGKGTVVLLPPLRYDRETFIKATRKGEEWTTQAVQFGKQLAGSLAEADRVLRSRKDISPMPDWARHESFRLAAEVALEHDINHAQREVAALEQAIKEKREEAERHASLRRLLYERGKQLEAAILEALGLLGFQAEQYRDAASEFDAVFTSSEGRFLGEAEGKDNSAINVDKLRQLEMNIQEDFERDEITTHAKGVLFGNAYRLLPPEERSTAFTDKCVQGAVRSGVALVRTPDLFEVARYLKEHDDPSFAAGCRLALLSTSGEVVVFPRPPQESVLGGTES